MVLVIGSILTSNSQFKALKFRLLLSYLGVMVTILGTTGIAIYQVVSYSLYQQLDRHLLTLAETAAQTLDIVKHEYAEHQENLDHDQENRPENISNLMAKYQEKTLINNQNISAHSQGVEWFNEEYQLLVKEGNLFPHWSLDKDILDSEFVTDNHIRSFILPVIVINHTINQEKIIGYIRVNESIKSLEIELNYLRWGLSLGGLFALFLTALGGLWLTGQSVKPIEKSFQQLKQFTNDASHELRSPLTIIKTHLDLLQSYGENIDPNINKKIRIMALACEEMTGLVEDLLLLARLEQPTIKKAWLKIPIEEILEDLIDELTIKIEQKNINLQYKLLPNIWVKGNGLQLKRIFTNLLENAVQYTPINGKIEIKMTLINNNINIIIKDNGIGIAKSDLDHIFDRFWRADQARERRSGGMGMGLSIAQSIAQNHGGKIIVTSELGVGSCFQVQLPLDLS